MCCILNVLIEYIDFCLYSKISLPKFSKYSTSSIIWRLLYHNEIIPLKKWAHNYITLTQCLISVVKLVFILRVNLDLIPWSDGRVEECANTVVISQGILPTCKFRSVLNMYIMLAESLQKYNKAILPCMLIIHKTYQYCLVK